MSKENSEVVKEALKDSRFLKAVGRGTVKVIHDDYAIVFDPSTAYYNRGRNVVASSIKVVTRKNYDWHSRGCHSFDVATDTRPTKSEIAKFEIIAEALLETITTVEEYVAKVGPGVVLVRGKYGTLVDPAGVPVLFIGSTYNSSHLVKQGHGTTFVTTTPEFEASEEKRLLEERQEKRNEAVELWIEKYEAATPEEKRAIVSNIVRV